MHTFLPSSPVLPSSEQTIVCCSIQATKLWFVLPSHQTRIASQNLILVSRGRVNCSLPLWEEMSDSFVAEGIGKGGHSHSRVACAMHKCHAHATQVFVLFFELIQPCKIASFLGCWTQGGLYQKLLQCHCAGVHTTLMLSLGLLAHSLVVLKKVALVWVNIWLNLI